MTEKLNSRLRVRKKNKANVFRRFGGSYSIPTGRSRRCSCVPIAILTTGHIVYFLPYDLWTTDQKKLFLSREYIFELKRLNSAILCPPWPDIQKKSQVKIGWLYPKISFILYKFIFPFETYSISDMFWDHLLCEIIIIEKKKTVFLGYAQKYMRKSNFTITAIIYEPNKIFCSYFDTTFLKSLAKMCENVKIVSSELIEKWPVK